jgi:hypothetical protein
MNASARAIPPDCNPTLRCSQQVVGWMSEPTNSWSHGVLSNFLWIKLCYRRFMIVREAKLKHGTAEQYSALDEAIRTAQFIRNKAVRYWMDNPGTSKADLYSICKDLAKEFDFAKKLNAD